MRRGTGDADGAGRGCAAERDLHHQRPDARRRARLPWQPECAHAESRSHGERRRRGGELFRQRAGLRAYSEIVLLRTVSSRARIAYECRAAAALVAGLVAGALSEARLPHRLGGKESHLRKIRAGLSRLRQHSGPGTLPRLQQLRPAALAYGRLLAGGEMLSASQQRRGRGLHPRPPRRRSFLPARELL